ncbi:MAG: YvcK family protein [Armatimonadetes bacterium]|nr:YvcK family protein [Armatimonadota bacterium]
MPAWRRWAKWLVPGLGVKRWLIILGAGVLLTSTGLAFLLNIRLLGLMERALIQAILSFYLVTGRLVSPLVGGVGLLLAGGVIIAIAVRGMVRAIAGAFLPRGDPRLVEIIRRQRRRERGPSIVVLGGGTGLSTLLRGLKRHTTNLTAVVTVFDDGGSSGRLRRELGILPPGDIRDCLVALAEAEPLMTRLFEHRFQGGALDGHAFGNLFIASLIEVTGDLELAVRESGKVLAIRGRVLPSTLDDVALCAEMEDGTVVEGESRIPRAGQRIRRVFLKPPTVRPLDEVLEAIAHADLVLLGPGSLYTSVIPNLLVSGVADALRASSGPRAYVCNVMTQPGETTGFKASDHARVLQEHVGPGLFTHVLVNTQPPRNRVLLQRYREEGAVPVEADLDAIRRLGVEPVGDDLISEQELLRHDPTRIARLALRLVDGLDSGRARRPFRGELIGAGRGPRRSRHS